MQIKFKEYIKENIQDKITKRGIVLYQNGAVKQVDVTDLNGQIHVEAKVQGSGDNIYDIWLTVAVMADAHIYLLSGCSCPYSNSYIGPCKHIVATMIAVSKKVAYDKKTQSIVYLNAHKAKNGKTYNIPRFETDSILATNLSQDLYKEDVSNIPLTPESIEIIPEFDVLSGYYEDTHMIMKCRIKAGKTYLIKHLDEFVDNFYYKRFYTYGKFLAFKHDVNLLTEQSQKLFWAINRHYSWSGSDAQDNRFMEMDALDFEEIFGMCMNDNIKFCGLDTYVTDEDPQFKISIHGTNVEDWVNQIAEEDEVSTPKLSQKNKNKILGATISGRKFSVLAKGKNAWVYQDKTIYKCSEEFTNEVLPVLEKLELVEIAWHTSFWNLCAYNKDINTEKNSRRFEHEVNLKLGVDDFTKFCHMILPTLEEYDLIESSDVDFSEYKPVEPTFKFYITYIEQDCSYFIEPKVTYSKGELDFFTETSELRDSKKEAEVMGIVKKYFKEPVYRYVDYSSLDDVEWGSSLNRNQQEKLYCQTDDEIFNLFCYGLEELSHYGDIYTSENWREFVVKEPPHLDIDMSVANGLIDFSVTSSKLSDSEIVNILRQYKLDQKYFVNDDGEYIFVDNKQIKALSEITSTLNLDVDSLRDIEVPLYRAMYLDDKILSENKGFRTKRDKAFKELISKIKSFKTLDIDVPSCIKADFRMYQKEGFRWLTTLCEFNLGAILADDMGLGKTLQAIAVIVQLLQKNGVINKSGKLCAQRKIAQKNSKSPAQKTSTSSAQIASKSSTASFSKILVVCPASLVYNWKDEFEKFASFINVRLIVGNAKQRQDAIKADASVYVTSYNSLARDILHYKDTKFALCILDEAQYIKNSTTQIAKATKKVNAINRFVLTGTPIENNLGDLWSIFDFLMPGYLFSKKQFGANFSTKIKNGDEEALSELQKLVTPFILRRLKGEVLTELPDKVENIQYIDLLPEQRKLYDAHVAIMRRDILATDNKEFKTKTIKFLSMLMKLRQICCSPELLHENDADGQEANSLEKIDEKNGVSESHNFASAKIDATLETISDCIASGHKVLVFSQFTSMLEILQREFANALPSATSLYLCGKHTKEQRRGMVKKFQDGKVDVFFISLKAGGTGLNLTAADRVIHVDPWWNFAAEQQASDRTHRIGQKNSVFVTKLVAKDTIEERIIKMQKSKKKLSDAIVSVEASTSAKFNKDELLQLLS